MLLALSVATNILFACALIWLVNKTYSMNLRLENLVPLSFMKEVRDEIVQGIRQHTEATPTRRDDWIDDVVQQVANYGIGKLENRTKNNAQVVLEIPEGGLG